MKPMRRLLVLAALAVAGTGASSCADNESQIFVRGVIVPDSTTCTLKADPTGSLFLSGVLDVALRDEYRAGLLVGNQLVERGNSDQLRTETDRVVLRGAEVELYNQDETLRSAFSVPGTGFVDPGTGSDPGYGVIGVTLVPASEAAKFQQAFGDDRTADATITAAVRVFGDTLGGLEVESGQLGFPIIVCNGCLVSYVGLDPLTNRCVTTAEFEPDEVPCLIGQDQVVDCRLCLNKSACQEP